MNRLFLDVSSLTPPISFDCLRFYIEARRSRIATVLILLTVMSILIATFYLIYKPPAFVIRYFQRRWSDVLWSVSASSKLVALTIDDGPSEYTDEIIQILKTSGASATFFIIGSQSRRARGDAARSNTQRKRAGKPCDARRAFAIPERCDSRQPDPIRGRNAPQSIRCR
jgi:Polysaccharide deacetylase